MPTENNLCNHWLSYDYCEHCDPLRQKLRPCVHIGSDGSAVCRDCLEDLVTELDTENFDVGSAHYDQALLRLEADKERQISWAIERAEKDMQEDIGDLWRSSPSGRKYYADQEAALESGLVYIDPRKAHLVSWEHLGWGSEETEHGKGSEG